MRAAADAERWRDDSLGTPDGLHSLEGLQRDTAVMPTLLSARGTMLVAAVLTEPSSARRR
jgi:hypothetical protein